MLLTYVLVVLVCIALGLLEPSAATGGGSDNILLLKLWSASMFCWVEGNNDAQFQPVTRSTDVIS